MKTWLKIFACYFLGIPTTIGVLAFIAAESAKVPIFGWTLLWALMCFFVTMLSYWARKDWL